MSNIVSFFVVVLCTTVIVVLVVVISLAWAKGRLEDFLVGFMVKRASLHKEHEVLLKLEAAGLDDKLSQKIIESKGNALAKKMIEVVLSVFSKPNLQSLKLIADGIAIVTQPFKKESFFTENGHVQLFFWGSFRRRILGAIPDEIPAFEGTLKQTELARGMNDSEILSELNNPKPFTIPEFSAIIRDLLTKQPNGESGRLLTNDYGNPFYVQLADNQVVVICVIWRDLVCDWGLRVSSLDDIRSRAGQRVLSRSSDALVEVS